MVLEFYPSQGLTRTKWQQKEASEHKRKETTKKQRQKELLNWMEKGAPQVRVCVCVRVCSC